MLLLITTISVCTAQASSVADGSGDRQDKTDQYRSPDECVSGIGQQFIDYDTELGKLLALVTQKAMQSKLVVRSCSKFQKGKEYYPQTEYYSSSIRVSKKDEPSPHDNALWAVDGKLQARRFFDIHQNQYQKFCTIEFPPEQGPREIDAEYTCKG